MIEPSAQIAVFAKIPDDKIRALADMLDESIIRKPSMKKIREVTGGDLSEIEVASVSTAFYNFFMSKDAPQRIIRIVDSAPLEDQKKAVLKQALKSIHEKSDAQKISQMRSVAELDAAGHPHFHQLQIYTELRPVSDNGEITKMVPKLVISCVLHEPNTHDDRPVSVQMDLEEGRSLVKQISEQLEALETEIKFMKEKLGDGVID